jgi:hypothetical protein
MNRSFFQYAYRVFLALSMVITVSASVPAAAEVVKQGGYQVLEIRPGQGELCLVCGKLVYDADVVEIRYRGRTFFVGAPLMQDFEADPDRYFKKLEARSALFDESSLLAVPLSFGWLIFGVYAFVGVMFAALLSYFAFHWGQPPLRWMFIGLFANVFGLIALLVTPKRPVSFLGVPSGLTKIPSTYAPVACSECGAFAHPSAGTCLKCGAGLNPAVLDEMQKVMRGVQG